MHDDIKIVSCITTSIKKIHIKIAQRATFS